MKAIKYALLITALVIGAIGCSGSNNTPIAMPGNIPPAQEDMKDVSTPDRDTSMDRVLLGIWEVTFDWDEMRFSVEDARHLQAHYNLTDYLMPPACNDCFDFTINSFNPTTRILNVDVTFRNPTPISARDVRGILFTNDYGHLLTNDDGWTQFWDVPGGQNINPFKAFAKSVPNRVFAGGAEHSENYLIYIPQPPNFNKIKFAVDGSWPGNCKDPYSIDNFTMNDILYGYTGASVGVSVDVYDWQDDVESVTLNAPDITGMGFVDFTYSAGATWVATLVNSEGETKGEFDALITATSVTSPNHILYKYVPVTVTKTKSPVVNSIDPDSADVGETVEGLTITGEDFLAPVIVIFNLDLSVISTYNVEVLDAMTITCDVDIPLTADAGLYDVIVINVDMKAGLGFELFTVNCPEPTITGINPGTGGRGSMLHQAEITGTNFIPPDFDVVLKKAGELDIPVAFVQYIDTEHLTVDFHIPIDAALGLYDVEITNGCGAAGVGTELFEVTKAGWVRIWGDSGYDGGAGICVEQTGDILATSWFTGTVDFDPGPGVEEQTAAGSYAVALSRFDEQGNFKWVRSWGNSGEGNLKGPAIDLLGNIWVTGSYLGTIDLDPGPGIDEHTAVGGEDVYLIKFDTDGNFVWGISFGGTEEENPWGIAVDGLGNSWVTGRFIGTADFNPDGGDEHESNGDYDVFLCKFNPDGDLEWAHTWGSVEEERGYDVDVDGLSNCWVVGFFMNEVDFDPNEFDEDKHTSLGKYDVFLSKFTTDGDFAWVQVWGDVEFDYGYGVTVDIFGNTWATGWFGGTVDMDPGDGVDNHTSGDSHDAFLSKFDAMGHFSWSRTWGGEDKQWGYTVTADDMGNAWVGGQYRGTADFDPGGGVAEHDSNGAEDAYFSKFDVDGNFQWVHVWGDTDYDIVTDLATDMFGNSLATGWFEGTVDFEPGDGIEEHESNGFYDVCLTKLDPNGEW